MIEKYDKLVRDRIPEIIEADGHRAVTSRLVDAEFELRLIQKLTEEQQELDKERNLEEIADMLEILFRSLGFTVMTKRKPSSLCTKSAKPEVALKKAICLRKSI